MARQARIVLENTPHHIAQRGNRGEIVFFEKADFEQYLSIMNEQCTKWDIAIWAWCLLPNQVHMIVVPARAKRMAQAIGEGHRRYTRYINEKKEWRGHLFQDRFFSYPMDDKTAIEAAHFIETLPVVSAIAPKPENYLWSSARSHLRGKSDDFLSWEKPLSMLSPDWGALLDKPPAVSVMEDIRQHLQTGRPRGNEGFIDSIEDQVGKRVRALPVGRPKKRKAA